VLVVAIWAIAWPLAVLHAVTSPWAPSGEVPSPQRVHAALMRVQASAAVGIPLPAVGCAVATWCRRPAAAGLLGAGVVLAVLVSAILFGFVL
jgi:hypothetical protein